MDKVIVAFTGGLQSTVTLHWLKTHEQCKVIAFAANLGQHGKMHLFAEHALRVGADSVHVEDLRDEFCRNYIFPALKASAVYESGYLLSSALAHALIASALARLAREESCDYVAHGAGRRSNNMARFEAAIAALAPDLNIISPADIPPLESRQEALRYSEERGLHLQGELSPCISLDRNLWGSAIAPDPRQDTWQEIPEELFELTKRPEDTPQEPQELVVRFERGEPVSVDGDKRPPWELIDDLNGVAGRHGVGRVELYEDTLAGLKARQVYECPAATVLMTAHQALDALTLDYEVLRTKAKLSDTYAELIYAGAWFSRLKEALDAFVDVTQQYVTGDVRLRLNRGVCKVIAQHSEYSLYDGELAYQDAMRGMDGRAAGKLWSLRALPYRVVSRMQKRTPDRR